MSFKDLLDFGILEQKYPNQIGYIYALLSHLFFVSGHYFIQKASKHLNSVQVLYLIGIQLTTYNYVTLVTKKLSPYSPKPQTTKMLWLRGICGFIGGCFLLSGLPLVPLSEAVVLQMTTPAFTGILAIFLLSEVYDTRLLLTTLFSFIGVMLISKPDFIFGTRAAPINGEKSYDKKSLGIILLLITSVIASFAQIIIKKLGNMSNPCTTALYLGIVGVFGAPILQIINGVRDIYLEDIFHLMIVGVLRYASHYFLNKSYAHGEAGKISLMFYSQVPFAYIIDLIFVGLRPDFYSVLGSISIFSCVFIMLHKQYQQNSNVTR